MTSNTNTGAALIGAWKLLSFQFEEEGGAERHHVYDEKPSGVIIFTPEGRMMALLTAGTRDRADNSALFDLQMAYSARYKLQDGDRLMIAVDCAWHPSWVGAEQVRYAKLDGDVLSLTTDFQEHPKFPGKRVRGLVVWQKEATA
jgi:hypothetical protein